MSAEHSHHLDPETLDPEALDPAVYHTIVGPVLQVAADAAAKRGDPTLHADMPAMLALVDIVTRLADLYMETWPDSGADTEMLQGAPAAACVMVLQEAGLEAQAIGQCLAALETAYTQVHENNVIDDARPHVAMAWEHLADGQQEQARECLTRAAQTIIAAIEDWQVQVH